MSSQPPDPAWIPDPPSRKSEALASFYASINDSLNFVLFVATLATRVDEVQRIARTALSGVGSEAQGVADLEDGGVGNAVRELRRFRLYITETTLTRSVDSYLSYIAEVIAAVFVRRPETMKSGETVRLDRILSHTNMEELIESLAEDQVERLGYQSVGELAERLKSRIGLELFSERSELESMSLIADLRNVIVHNKSTINGRFLRKHPGSEYQLGARLDLSFDDVISMLASISAMAIRFDTRVCEKFGIPQS